ncbi:MAG TPA: type VI secretion system tip protein TssI/VgrG [Rhodothermales bacterium]|nr:type VI secretion system tip protein TssI/VgrG [Rhodothermales bacterium]
MSTTADLQFEFVIDDPAFPADTFQVASFDGFEQVNQTFQFSVDLVSYDSDLSLSEIAFKPATLEVYRDTQQLIFHGLVAHFEQGPHVGDRYGYRVVFVPPMWFLSLYFNSRIFLDRTVPEIIEEVLQEVGFTGQHYEMRLNATYPTREYLAQYQETDLNFVCRLCEREGIRFSFHADDGKIIFSDEPTSESNLIEQVLTYNPGGGLEASAEAVRTFTSQERITSDEMSLRDYNYRIASATHEVLEAAEGSIQLAEGSPWQGDWLKHYEYGLHHQDQGNTDRLTTVRLEGIVCQRQMMRGTSGYVGLRVGHIMTVEDHFRDELNGDFFLTRITHRGTQAASVPGLMGGEAEDTDAYLNEFECISAEVQYRPPRITPVPKVNGIMTGVIESAGGDYAHLDEEGRYRVRMHFDKGTAQTAEASHWIRMKQAYSGPEYGMHFPNHKGTEMVWACVDGDPDRPMALGTSPNPSQKTPVTSENKWQNILRTWSGNQMIMDDKIDEEWIQINTPAENVLRLDDKDDYILASTTNKHQVLLDDKNRLILVQTTDGHFLKMDDENKKITLQSKDGHYMFIDDENEMISIADKDTKHHFTIDIANKKLTIQTVDGDIDILAEQGHIEIRAETLHTETTEDTTHQAANIHSTAGGDFTVEATNIKHKASAEYTEKAPSIKSNADALSELTGGALVDIKGMMVKINS